MSTTIHQTMSYLYLPDSNNLKIVSLIFATLKPTFEGLLLKKFTGRQ